MRARTTIRTQATSGEDAHQAALIDWTKHYRVPGKTCSLHEYIFHIPNGGKRHKGTAVKLKRIGTKAGVSDLFIPIARQGYHGLWIEMKDVHIKGKDKPRASKEQREWLAKMREEGYDAHIAWGWLQARNIILDYFGDTRYAR